MSLSSFQLGIKGSRPYTLANSNARTDMIGPTVEFGRTLQINVASWLSFEFVNTPLGSTLSPDSSNLGCGHVMSIFYWKLITCFSVNFLPVYVEISVPGSMSVVLSTGCP